MAGAPPAWTGLTFTYPKLHSAAPPSLAPSSQKLPSPFVVAIVGGSRNIGAESAKAFAAAGATGILITGTNEAALAKTKTEVEAAGASHDLKVTTITADASDNASAKLVADAVESTYGRLDLLVNNAATLSVDPSAFAKPHEINIENVEKTMQLNYVGKFNMAKALLPLLLKTDGAKTIVNITSAMSHFGAMGAIGYNISELAVNRLTEALAQAYAADGIVVHAVHPGIVATMPAPIGMEAPEARAMATDDVALCGAFLVWLVKEKRDWLSGRYLSANWDVEELESKKESIVSEDKLKMRMVV
jgi:NAD(P)-dependent dehydrogenase (short-subunit alcohol dehydrogenase family)